MKEYVFINGKRAHVTKLKYKFDSMGNTCSFYDVSFNVKEHPSFPAFKTGDAIEIVTDEDFQTILYGTILSYSIGMTTHQNKCSMSVRTTYKYKD